MSSQSSKKASSKRTPSTEKPVATREMVSRKEKWLTPAEAAELRGVTRAAIYKAVAQGRLPHQKMLGRIALRESEVLAWADSGAKPGRPRGIPMTEETKATVAQAQRRRWAKKP